MLNDLQAHKLIGNRASASVNPEEWTRPADWLSLPNVTASEQKFVGLVPIYNTEENFLAFEITGACTVNWGDGNIENFESGHVEHSYDWNDISSSTLTSAGHRQVVVSIVPQSGESITGLDLGIAHSKIAPGYYGIHPWLDIKLSLPDYEPGGTIFLSDGSIWGGYLRNVSVVNPGQAQHVEFIWCSLLHSITIENAVNITSLGLNFCYSISKVTILNLASVTELSGFMNYTQIKELKISGLNSLLDAYFNPGDFMQKIELSGLTLLGDAALTQAIDSFRSVEDIRLEDLNSVTSIQKSSYWDDLKGSIKLTGLTSVTSLEDTFTACSKLRSITLGGLQNVITMEKTFLACTNLTNVSLDDTQNVSNFERTFENCNSLLDAPQLNCISATNANSMFRNCTKLRSVPAYDMQNVVTARLMFSGCNSLFSVGLIDLSNCEDVYSMFYGCYSLPTIPLIDTSKVTNFDYMFDECSALLYLPALDFTSAEENFYGYIRMFNGYANMINSAPFANVSKTIEFDNCALSRQSILDIFNNLLPVQSETISLYGNYGANDLTVEDMAIATEKGWTVAY